MLLNNAMIVNAETGVTTSEQSVRIVGERIEEIEPRLQAVGDEVVFDLHGQFIAPGLIDAHVHVVDVTTERYASYWTSPYYVAARAHSVLRDMLTRGFTTVRDAGGADAGLARAIDEGYLDGPALLPSGRAISQTGGHGDMRLGYGPASRDEHPLMGSIADGVDAVRAAVREELRRGAHQIKMMISGGIDSPRDVATSTQYTAAEISAAVGEAAAQGTYVMAHAYTPPSIGNGLEAGVRSIEHGNFLDENTAKQMSAHAAFLVPTLVVYESMCTTETRVDAPAPEVTFKDMLDAGLRSLELARRAGVKIVFGTDLMGGAHDMQSREFRLRCEALPPREVLRSATTTAADLLGLAHNLGAIRPGAHADLIVLDINPLEDISAVADPDRHLKMVIKSGRVVRPSL